MKKEKLIFGTVNETLDSWPDLRSAMLYTGGDAAQKFYQEMLDMKTFVSGTNGLEIMSKRGPGSVFDDI